MKLRNKKTGEITEDIWYEYTDENIRIKNGTVARSYDSLAELNEEWEDYEEPKTAWYIDSQDDIEEWRDTDCDDWTKEKAIGNYFETREDAMEAIKKLKAWKRLKDNGLEIKGWKFTPDMRHTKGNFVKVEAEIPYIVDNKADLDLLFGGEE